MIKPFGIHFTNKKLTKKLIKKLLANTVKFYNGFRFNSMGFVYLKLGLFGEIRSDLIRYKV